MDPSAVLELVGRIGGVVEPSPGFAARLSSGERHVWVAPVSSTLEELEREELQRVTAALGAPARSHVILEVGRMPGSGRLALTFAIELARMYPLVVENLSGADGPLLTLDDLLALDAAGGGIGGD